MHKTSVPLDPVYSIAPYTAGARIVVVVGLGDLLCIAVHLGSHQFFVAELLITTLRAIFCKI